MFDFSFYMQLLGSFGFGVAQTGVVVYLLWKIATNHLKHIADDVKEVSRKIDDMKLNCAKEGERIAKLEGEVKRID